MATKSHVGKSQSLAELLSEVQVHPQIPRQTIYRYFFIDRKDPEKVTPITSPRPLRTDEISLLAGVYGDAIVKLGAGTTIGDLAYWNGTSWVVVAAHTAATLALLRQTGTGTVGGVPTWDATHGSAQHDSTVSKKRVSYIPIADLFFACNAGALSDSAWKDWTDGGVLFNKNDFDLVTAIYFCASFYSNSSYTAYMELYNRTDATEYTNSILSTASTSLVALKSADIKADLPTTEKAYRIRFHTDANGGIVNMTNAYLMVVQSE